MRTTRVYSVTPLVFFPLVFSPGLIAPSAALGVESAMDRSQSETLISGPVPSQVHEKPPLILGVGEQRLLQIAEIRRFSLGNRTLVQGVIRGRSLLLKGSATGQTDLWVWLEDGSAEHRSIQIERGQPLDFSPGLRAGLTRLTEAEIYRTASGVVLRGRLRTFDESARALALARGFPKEVLDETELEPDALARCGQQLSAALARTPWAAKLTIGTEAGRAEVRGALPSPRESLRARAVLSTACAAARFALESLPDSAPTVHFRVYLLELRHSAFGAFGVSWPAAQARAFELTSWGLRESLRLDLALEALEGAGNARLLARPEIVLRVPGESELFSGGELPIRTHTQYSSQLHWKTYGLQLRLKATHATYDRVRLEVGAEVSSLDPATGVESVPGVHSSRLKTQVDASFGAPLFLSGLLQNDFRKQARGVPLLRQLPVLGALFGSEDWIQARSELIAILLPSRQPPQASLERWSALGPAPPPRNFVSPEDEARLKQSPDYPWNAL